MLFLSRVSTTQLQRLERTARRGKRPSGAPSHAKDRAAVVARQRGCQLVEGLPVLLTTVPDLDRAVVTHAGKARAIRAEGNVPDGGVMAKCHTFERLCTIPAGRRLALMCAWGLCQMSQAVTHSCTKLIKSNLVKSNLVQSLLRAILGGRAIVGGEARTGVGAGSSQCYRQHFNNAQCLAHEKHTCNSCSSGPVRQRQKAAHQSLPSASSFQSFRLSS